MIWWYVNFFFFCRLDPIVRCSRLGIGDSYRTIGNNAYTTFYQLFIKKNYKISYISIYFTKAEFVYFIICSDNELFHRKSWINFLWNCSGFGRVVLEVWVLGQWKYRYMKIYLFFVAFIVLGNCLLDSYLMFLYGFLNYFSKFFFATIYLTTFMTCSFFYSFLF